MYLFKDSSISIHLVTNRGGLQLGEVASDGTEWKKRLTDFGAGVQAENYNEFLFDYISPDYKTFEPKPCWDSMYKFPVLACNQYVTEFMLVSSKTGPYDKVKSIQFKNGEADDYLTESDSALEGTYIHLKYDSKVFTDVTLSKEFISTLAQEMALLYDHVRFVLHMQNEDKSYIDEEYCYAGLDDYIKETTESINDPCSTFRIHESKDEPLGREYTAYVGVAVAFTKDKPSVQCYYNGHRLENGGAFLDELYKCLQEHINYISERACSHKFLRSAFNQAVKWELMTRNPVLNATLPKEEHQKREIWTAETLMHALEVCDDDILALAINLSFACSLRMGEMLGLTWDCIDISEESLRENNASIYVDKELQRVNRDVMEVLDNKDIIRVFPRTLSNTNTSLVLKTPKTKTSVRKIFFGCTFSSACTLTV